MNKSTKSDFSARLVEEMLKQGHEAPRSELKADAGALQRATGVKSITAARKYLEGTAIPKPEIMQKICDWLGLRVAYLRDGEEPRYANQRDGDRSTGWDLITGSPVDEGLMDRALDLLEDMPPEHLKLGLDIYRMVLAIEKDRGLHLSEKLRRKITFMHYDECVAHQATPKVDRISKLIDALAA